MSGRGDGGNSRITARMLLDRIDRLDERMNDQFAELRRRLDELPPRCADHEARIRNVESVSQFRTWESRIYGALAAIAAALGVKGVSE